MSNEEWWEKIEKTYTRENAKWILGDALRVVVELCNKWETKGSYCLPIEDVIKAIEKELQ